MHEGHHLRRLVPIVNPSLVDPLVYVFNEAFAKFYPSKLLRTLTEWEMRPRWTTRDLWRKLDWGKASIMPFHLHNRSSTQAHASRAFVRNHCPLLVPHPLKPLNTWLSLYGEECLIPPNTLLVIASILTEKVEPPPKRLHDLQGNFLHTGGAQEVGSSHLTTLLV